MGEIKSTLDIIMEKAKRFSVTEEEKKGFKRQELEGKIKGLLQKAVDGVLDSERFQVEVFAFQTKEKELVHRILQEEIVARIELGANNEALLKLLENIAGPASPAIRKVLAEFEKRAEKQKDSRRRTLVEKFKTKGISGSAVLPNLDADPEWLRARSEMKGQLQEEIRERLKSLPASLYQREEA
jgi:hypothetical protein